MALGNVGGTEMLVSGSYISPIKDGATPPPFPFVQEQKNKKVWEPLHNRQQRDPLGAAAVGDAAAPTRSIHLCFSAPERKGTTAVWPPPKGTIPRRGPGAAEATPPRPSHR